LFATLTLWLVSSGRTRWALATCAGALLSKETAAVLPLVLLAHARLIERRHWRDGAYRIVPFAALTLAWLLLHPTLLHRVSHPPPRSPNGEHPKPPAVVIRDALLSTVNADRLTLPLDPDLFRPAVTLVTALLLAGALWLALRRDKPRARVAAPVAPGAPR